MGNTVLASDESEKQQSPVRMGMEVFPGNCANSGWSWDGSWGVTVGSEYTAKSISKVAILGIIGMGVLHFMTLCSHRNERFLLSVLQLRLQQRRTREQLVDQGIMPRKTDFESSVLLEC